MDLLDFSYEDRFFGKDILEMTPEQGRAFIGTYQKLGYIKNDRLVILTPGKKVELYHFERLTGKMAKIAPEAGMEEEAISYYQGSSYLMKQKIPLGSRFVKAE